MDLLAKLFWFSTKNHYMIIRVTKIIILTIAKFMILDGLNIDSFMNW